MIHSKLFKSLVIKKKDVWFEYILGYGTEIGTKKQNSPYTPKYAT